MQLNFDKELKWFTKRLLQIRILKVRGFSLPIHFELSEITNNAEIGFDRSISTKEHLEGMIEEIRGYYIDTSKNPVNKENIRLEYSNNNLDVKIFGIDSKLLRSFITERLRDQTSLFETRANSELFYLELPTGITLSSAESEIFSKLRFKKDNNENLSYDEIFEICAHHKGPEQQSYRDRNDTETKMNTAARSTISYLLQKIKSSSMFEGMPKEKIIENVRGGGYSLML